MWRDWFSEDVGVCVCVAFHSRLYLGTFSALRLTCHMLFPALRPGAQSYKTIMKLVLFSFTVSVEPFSLLRRTVFSDLL